MIEEIVYSRGYITGRNPAWSWDFKCMEDFNLWFVRDGSGVFRTGGREVALSKGLCLAIPPGLAGSVRQRKGSPLSSVSAHFLLTGTERVSLPLYFWLDDAPFFEGLLVRSVRCHWSGEANDALHWLRCALDEISHSVAGAKGLRPRADEIEAICRRISLEPDRQWKVEGLAKEAFLCRERFSRVFSEIKGVSPQEFIIQARLEKAKAMLRSSGVPVSEVAKSCGYSSGFFFSRQFKQRTGHSPSATRRAALLGEA